MSINENYFSILMFALDDLNVCLIHFSSENFNLKFERKSLKYSTNAHKQNQSKWIMVRIFHSFRAVLVPQQHKHYRWCAWVRLCMAIVLSQMEKSENILVSGCDIASAFTYHKIYERYAVTKCYPITWFNFRMIFLAYIHPII